MKKFNQYLIFIIFILTGSYLQLKAQNIYQPYSQDLERDLYKTSTNSPQSDGLGQNQYEYNIGINSYLAHYRAVYQWNIADSVIPSGSTINSVQINFTYTKLIGNYELNAEFFNV